MMQEEVAVQPENRSEDQFVDVVVAESVGAMLAQHLESTGRGIEHPLKLQQRVQMAVWKQWGTAHVKPFQDAYGLGWFCGVANALNGEDMAAVIRTIHGNRMVCAVVEADEVQHFLATGHWQSEAARGLDPELEAEIAALENKSANGHARAVTGAVAAVPEVYIEPEPTPSDPRLIVWWEGVGEHPQVKEITYGEAQMEVLKLLMQGCRVQIWENPKTPEIKVSL
jgi:hypothetical protein